LAVQLHRDIYRRQALAVAGMLLFTVLYVGGNRFLGLHPAGETELVATFWAGIALVSYWSWSGRSQNYRDPGLTIIYILWSTLFLTLSILVSPSMRFVMMLAYLAMLPFGILGIGWRAFLGICLVTVGGYSSLVLYFRSHGDELFDIRLELMLGASFALAAMSLALVAREMVLLREAYGRKSRDLKAALARIEELSIRDEVTGLINRRYFMRRLNSQKAVSNREGRPFVVAIVDIDALDELGALHGEGVMQSGMYELGQMLGLTLREVDTVAAMGPGSFGILLSGAGLASGLAVIDRLRQSIANAGFASGVLHMTVSAGVVEYQSAETVEGLIERAGIAAAFAAGEGGNRISS